ncbi:MULTISPECIES: hypothetical protein [Streptosporangium]|uniref:Heme-degrading monooxygenase HmoA n=1 Tax=Streptosporangium brasiliense TaxID=47480 RepID=A0ABT9RL68_9ACTN|nr:hypothetical protein [Streptosporangium brasiliense]MDP9869556.1 heme-degrading monooxygenase HmoA [Streptosporangium brasiliense]
MLRSSWTPGPAADVTGPVLVAITEFRADRARDLPGIYRSGRALGRGWPGLDGAVGMWLWAEMLERRCGSVSIWQSEQALKRFVAWPEHLTIVRRYRRRGRLTSVTWQVARCEPAAIWAGARLYLSGRELPGEDA